MAEDSDGNSQEEDEYEQSDEESDAEGDVQCMSNAGEGINDADRRVMSRYIASVGSEWDMLSSRDKWKPFEVQVCVSSCTTETLCSFIYRDLVSATYLQSLDGSLSQSRKE